MLKKNTFVLALDGYVLFKPDAVVKLLDIQNTNKNIGAAQDAFPYFA